MDMSQKPEGATHWFPGSEGKDEGWVKVDASDYYFWGPKHDRWYLDEHDGPADMALCVVIPGSTTLETMLTEWRDLEARAQAAQAEADALFEHAGQCHGEIVVRLAELGWGAPRMVPGAPMVTMDTPLDMTDWRNWQVGDIVESLIAEQDVIVCGRYPITLTSSNDDGRCFEVRDGAGEIWPMHAEQLKWISRPSAQQ